jgi:cytochrome c-type protein NapB
MTPPRPSAPSGFSRLDIVRAVAGMVVLVLVLGAGLDRGEDGLAYPQPVAADSLNEPIAAEANVFRTREGELGVAPDFAGKPQAHARSPDIFRRLRAYPGAPPRIPHGLTKEEFRTTSCNACHRRGGWVARFGAYAPVTPHPEYASCVQCHVPLDELVGRPLPAPDDTLVCDQCHIDPDAPLPTFVEIDWQPAPWPEIGRQAMEGSPNVIPHDLEFRTNCLACHAGPGAIVGVRTDHPERVNCRQCHVPAVADDAVWPPEGGAAATSAAGSGGEDGSPGGGRP